MLITFRLIMGGLSDKTDMFKCVYHTRKIYINIFINLEKQLTIMYNMQMRIVKCENCGEEIQSRSAFAHMTLTNHKKVCKKS
jgi:hypothetical protein